MLKQPKASSLAIGNKEHVCPQGPDDYYTDREPALLNELPGHQDKSGADLGWDYKLPESVEKLD